MCEGIAVIRRGIDILASAIVLLILSPLFLAIAIAVRLDSPGNAIYRAWRAGKGGRRFQMLKFRSMVSNASQTGPAITSAGDARITRVGRFLRASKLDEFPQFWNVLMGDMTLIGPRPEALEIVERYTTDQRWILSNKPGLTGPSQISCSVDESMAVRSADTAEEYYLQHVLGRRLEMDAEYFRNRSATRDLALVGRTLRLILRAMLQRTA
jgi:lipopolysaccharide/colanic/teichoic acid biosynthesis glycosyltransferase